MSFSISDFKVGQRIDTPAKIKLWDNVIKRTFGGLDCAMNQYEKYSATGNWSSYKICGMISYLDELTGGDYGRSHPQIQRVSGTLATQFKKKFPSIHYLMSNPSNSNAILDAHFNISSNNQKASRVFFPNSPKSSTQTDQIDRSKVYSIISEIFSKNLNSQELAFISKQILS
jgi:hypothetical protein